MSQLLRKQITEEKEGPSELRREKSKGNLPRGEKREQGNALPRGRGIIFARSKAKNISKVHAHVCARTHTLTNKC